MLLLLPEKLVRFAFCRGDLVVYVLPSSLIVVRYSFLPVGYILFLLFKQVIHDHVGGKLYKLETDDYLSKPELSESMKGAQTVAVYGFKTPNFKYVTES